MTNAVEVYMNRLRKKVDAGQDVSVDLQIGARLVGDAAERATGEAKARLAAQHGEAMGNLLP